MLAQVLPFPRETKFDQQSLLELPLKEKKQEIQLKLAVIKLLYRKL